MDGKLGLMLRDQMNVTKAWSPDHGKNPFHRIEVLTQNALYLTALPDYLKLQLYRTSTVTHPFNQTLKEPQVVLFPSSLMDMPTGSMSVDQAAEALIELFCLAYERIGDHEISPDHCPDFLMLTSTYDTQQKLNRATLPLEEQAVAARAGVSWQKVVQLESLGLPLDEWIASLLLPIELRRQLYPGMIILDPVLQRAKLSANIRR